MSGLLANVGRSLAPHICRECFGRIIHRLDVFRCSGCGAMTNGTTPRAICTCGKTTGTGKHAGFRCGPNSDRGGASTPVLHGVAGPILVPLPKGSYVFRSAAEFFLLGTRGKPVQMVRNVRNLILAPVREHSRKPDEMRQNVMSLWSGRYVELFAREPAIGWDSWGLETDKFEPVAA